MKAILTEDYWANSQLSIVRHYGRASINGQHYIVVNKYGIDVFELSNPRSKHYVGDDQMAIPPGEPCDLVQKEWVPVYKALGREMALQLAMVNTPLSSALKLAGLKVKDEDETMDKKRT